MQRRCNDDAVKRRSKVNSPSFCQFSPSSPSRYTVYILFQSTHSLRSATFVADNPMRTLEPVSIHALLAECDLQKWHDNPPMVRFNPRTPCGVRLEPRPMPKVNLGFNPRTPCGVRHAGFKRVADMRWFQSTHSLRSATDKARRWIQAQMVSIHALLAECDWRRAYLGRTQRRFNPRTPCGVRLRPTLYIATQQSKSYFAPTSLKRPSLHGCSF